KSRKTTTSKKGAKTSKVSAAKSRKTTGKNKLSNSRKAANLKKGKTAASKSRKTSASKSAKGVTSKSRKASGPKSPKASAIKSSKAKTPSPKSVAREKGTTRSAQSPASKQKTSPVASKGLTRSKSLDGPISCPLRPQKRAPAEPISITPTANVNAPVPQGGRPLNLQVKEESVGGINKQHYKVEGGRYDGWWAHSDNDRPGAEKIGQNEIKALRHFDKTAVTGKDANGKTWIVQEDKGVGLEKLPEFKSIIEGPGTVAEKTAQLNPMIDARMGAVRTLVTNINKEGYQHGDIQPGNIRWNTQTGVPTAIDWGMSTKIRPASPWYKGGKIRDHFLKKQITQPLERVDPDKFKAAMLKTVVNHHNSQRQGGCS
ncbi:hypothetical protein CPB86DRAFT_291262, partial [Serendipita vermifera]